MDEYQGSITETRIDARLDGTVWNVVVTVTQKRSLDLSSWEEKSTGCRVLDDDKDKAMSRAMFSVTEYLQSIGFDLFSVKE